MYYLCEGSNYIKQPYFTKLSNKNEKNFFLFFPEFENARWFYEEGMPEKNLIEFILNNYVQKDKNIIDIGAHIGTYTIYLGDKANYTYAFECNKKAFCYLAANVALHNLENKTTLYNFGLGNRNDLMDYFYRSEDGGGNGFKYLNSDDINYKRERIEIKKLDSLNLNNIGFIKIDVEGFEKEVLEGSIETLKRNNYPSILFECWGEWKQHEEKVNSIQIKKDVFNLLENLGYQITGFDEYEDMFIAVHSSNKIYQSLKD